MKVNPQMLVLGREASGLTQKELAEAIEVSQAQISKFEAGLLDVSDDSLDKLTVVLNRPRSFFFQTDRVYGFGSLCVFHRKRVTVPVRDLKQMHAAVNV